jgi:hypothetical protein
VFTAKRATIALAAAAVTLSVALTTPVTATPPHAEPDAPYDSGHRPLPTGTGTQASLARDSWLPPALAAEVDIVNANDSWATAAIAAYHAELDRLHDSGRRPVSHRAGPRARDRWATQAIAAHDALLRRTQDRGIAQAFAA